MQVAQPYNADEEMSSLMSVLGVDLTAGDCAPPPGELDCLCRMSSHRPHIGLCWSYILYSYKASLHLLSYYKYTLCKTQ